MYWVGRSLQCACSSHFISLFTTLENFCTFCIHSVSLGHPHCHSQPPTSSSVPPKADDFRLPTAPQLLVSTKPRTTRLMCPNHGVSIRLMIQTLPARKANSIHGVSTTDQTKAYLTFGRIISLSLRLPGLAVPAEQPSRLDCGCLQTDIGHHMYQQGLRQREPGLLFQDRRSLQQGHLLFPV